MAATWKPLGHGSPSLEARHPFMYAVGATSLEECQLACEQHSSMCDLIVFRPPRLADAGDDAGTLLKKKHNPNANGSQRTGHLPNPNVNPNWP